MTVGGYWVSILEQRHQPHVWHFVSQLAEADSGAPPSLRCPSSFLTVIISYCRLLKTTVVDTSDLHPLGVLKPGGVNPSIHFDH